MPKLFTKIPGGFFKREGKQSEKEILTSRLIDRPIRPLFPEGAKEASRVCEFVEKFTAEHPGNIFENRHLSWRVMPLEIDGEGVIVALSHFSSFFALHNFYFYQNFR